MSDFTTRWRDAPSRLDRALRSLGPEWTRSAVNDAISSRRVRVNGRVVWMSSWTVERGDRLDVESAGLSIPAPDFDAFRTEWIVHDGGDFVVVDKPSGLRSEAVRVDDRTPNLLTLARTRLGDDLVLAHRLDRDTSGLLVLTRPGAIRGAFDDMFRAHTLSKRYVAVVHDGESLVTGRVVDYLAPDPSRRDQMIVVARGGKTAVTDIEVIERADGLARIDLWPQTGRTHQLRVQCASRGYAIVGDRLYGDAEEAHRTRLMLHAAELVIPAFDGRDPITFTAPSPF